MHFPYFCRQSAAAHAAICAPSSGGTGSKLNSPVSSFAAQNALPRMVVVCARRTAHTQARAKLTAGPAAASTNRWRGDSLSPAVR